MYSTCGRVRYVLVSPRMKTHHNMIGHRERCDTPGLLHNSRAQVKSLFCPLQVCHRSQVDSGIRAGAIGISYVGVLMGLDVTSEFQGRPIAGAVFLKVESAPQQFPWGIECLKSPAC